jgi:DNA-binding beta-propeller fold protein YncE
MSILTAVFADGARTHAIFWTASISLALIAAGVLAFAAEPAAAPAGATKQPRGAPKPVDPPRAAEDFVKAAKPVTDRTPPAGYTGQYFKLYYPGISDEGEQRFAVTYTLWIPDGVKTLRGIIVHQHGAGMTASKEGSTAAYDLHWQALAKKWDCALLGPCYHVLNDGDWEAAGSIYWMDPRRGSEKTFLKALDDFAVKAEHPELAKVPWVLWGHSAGGIWSDIMSTLHPDRVVAVYCRSGSQPVFMDRPLQVPPTTITPAACAIPIMLSCGVKEKWITDKLMMTFKAYREKGGLVGFAADPRTDHECGDSRYFAIPYLDNCLALRLPEKWSKDQTLKAVDASKAYLAAVGSERTVPAAEFKGKPEEAVWLPNEAVAKAYAEYVKTGAVGDTTPPPTPFNLRVMPKGDQGTEITWSAEADLESGTGQFIIMRDGKELAKVPEKPVGFKEGRPLFQKMTYHDTPDQPMPDMRYLDASAKAGEKHMYAVVEVNGVGLKSKPTGDAPWPYVRISSVISYEVDPSWPERRPEVVWGPMSGATTDPQGNIWVVSRKNMQVIEYQPDGKFVQAWGEGLMAGPHEIKVDGQGNVWLVDNGKHCVLKCSPQGKVLMTLGTPGESGSDDRHFYKPTDVAISAAGDVYVADGYGNARVVHFDKDGKFVGAWGKLGVEPGEFNLPHAIAVDSKGRVYVGDRNNARIQVFTADGEFIEQWRNIVVPCAFCMTKDDELWVNGTSPMTWRRIDNMLGYPPKDQLVMKFNTAGKLLQLWSFPMGEDGKEQPGDLNWAHGMTVDAAGNLYIVDVMGKRVQKFVRVPEDSKATIEAVKKDYAATIAPAIFGK